MKIIAENELIEQAKTDKDALLKVLSKYAPLVKSCADSICGNKSDFEDLVQEGTLGLISAVKAYNSSKSSFSTFAKLCVLRSLYSAVRSAENKGAIPAELLVDTADLELVDRSADPAIYVSAREEYNEILKAVKEKLSAFEYSVFCDKLSGFSNSEIAKKRGVDKKAIENANLRVHNKIKQIK